MPRRRTAHTIDDLVPEDERRLLRRKSTPRWVDPTLATLTENYFSDPDWVFEPKLDGVRCLAFKKGGSVRLLSRNKLSLNDRYPEIVKAIAGLPLTDVLLDGEAAVLSGGVTRFQSLQRHLLEGLGHGSLALFAFDIPFANGYDLRNLPLLTRKRVLEEFVPAGAGLTIVKHAPEIGEELLHEACAKGWEGLIAKKADSTYASGRSKLWLKFKCTKEQEFVIGGFTDPQGSRVGFGALLVGYYDGSELRYAGKVGTGYNVALLRSLLEKMTALEQEESPFAGPPPVRKAVHWITPALVAQVGFSEWTADGRLRHPRFIGLRDDKTATEVVRES
ncbi:MAG: non-homologous end-joining DNA ligase [Actinomycetota bacterium]|nr:non-homologous end-joining DNA ligase [Actinomycetota bacterium]